MARQNSSRYDFQDDKIVWYLDTYTNLNHLKSWITSVLKLAQQRYCRCEGLPWYIVSPYVGISAGDLRSVLRRNHTTLVALLVLCISVGIPRIWSFIVEKLLSVIQDSWTFILQVCRTSTTTTSPMSSLVLIRWATGTWTWTKHRRTTTGSPATFAWSTMAVQTPLKVVQLATWPTMIVTILSTGTGSKIMTRVSSY